MIARTLDDDLRLAASVRGDRTALVAGERRLTWSALDAEVEAVAGGLRRLGVARGDRVAVVLRNGAEAAIAIYAALRAGAAFVPLNPTAKEDKLAHLLDHCGAVVAVCGADGAARVRAAALRAPGLRHVVVTGGDGAADEEEIRWGALLAGGPPAGEPVSVLDTDLASLIYTSGSTGVPKGVTFLHRNMHFVAGSIVEYLGLTEDDCILCVLPLSHTYGLYQLVLAVRTGATLVLEEGIAFPGRVVEVLEREQITVLPGVPTVWDVLVSLHGLAARRTALRVLTNAGAALSVARLAEVRDTFPGAQLFSMYGQTECTRVCYLPPFELDARPGSVGVAIPGTEVWIEDEHGRAVAPGVVGELVVRGDHVMQGYWRDADGTARKLVAGRLPGDRVLHTGDLFRRDEEGFLYFVGRLDDIIKSRGEKVAPREVEEVLYAVAGVREAAVVGVDDERLGQAVVAHVSAVDGASLDPTALRRHCAAQLEDFKIPRRVVVHGGLPKTENGKLDRMSLAALG